MLLCDCTDTSDSVERQRISLVQLHRLQDQIRVGGRGVVLSRSLHTTSSRRKWRLYTCLTSVCWSKMLLVFHYPLKHLFVEKNVIGFE